VHFKKHEYGRQEKCQIKDIPNQIEIVTMSIVIVEGFHDEK